MRVPALGTVLTAVGAHQASTVAPANAIKARQIDRRYVLMAAELLVPAVIVVLAACLRARLLGDVPRYGDE